jgi:ABC-type uncharacterized transport system involved in gliding motility auxiliary subunit
MKSKKANGKRPRKKYWKYVFWLSPLLIIMGLTAGVVAGTWVPIPAGLLIAGLVLLGIWLILEMSSGRGFWGKRSTQVSTNAIAATLSVLFILGLLNFLAIRYRTQVDFTENQLFTLAPQTQQVLRNLEKPVKIWVFDKELNPIDADILNRYRQENPKFSYEWVDPFVAPALARQYDVKMSFGDPYGEVHLEYGDRREFMTNVGPDSRLSEAKVTNALAKLLSDRTAKVYFLQGHQELTLTAEDNSISQGIKALEGQNFTSEPLQLIEARGVPSDAAAVIIAGPKQALLDQEIQALRGYLQRGGSVFVMIDPATDLSINRWLQDWGVTVEDSFVIDVTSNQPIVPLISNYGPHPITQDFSKNYSFFPQARPIEVNAVEGVEANPLLITNEQSWAEKNIRQQPVKFDANTDTKGPLLLGVALERRVDKEALQQAQVQASPSPQLTTETPAENAEAVPTENPELEATPETPTAEESPTPTPGETPAATPSPAPEPAPPTVLNDQARMVVIGSSEFVRNGVFNQQLNGDVFLNSVSWLSRQEAQTLSIRPKAMTNRRILMSMEQARLIGWTALVIIPLIGFGAAGILWWSRR